MMRQIRLLTKISLYGMFGLNELRFTRDTRKRVKACLLGILWALVIVMLAGYVGLASFGLTAMGMGRYVPGVLGMAVSLLVFFFTIFKAGPVLFDRKAYEKQIALPVTVRAVIVSRFLSMYITDMLLGFLVMLPGMAVYGVMEGPGVSFWITGILAGIFLPLLPMTAASVLGALIAGIASRWRRKNLVSILLTFVFITVIMVGSLSMGGMEESELNAMVAQLGAALEGQIRSLYPPAMWVCDAMVSGEMGKLLLFVGRPQCPKRKSRKCCSCQRKAQIQTEWLSTFSGVALIISSYRTASQRALFSRAGSTTTLSLWVRTKAESQSMRLSGVRSAALSDRTHRAATSGIRSDF